ncbi:hypothetical protein [Flavisericum labens]|uniref:hypothetical protein n=1 Tax=Flavisericum labens TaxID=3377112 RepID=UPI00387B4CD3
MKKTEICLHCGDDYIPKRRGVQKFCCNSCRSRYWTLKSTSKPPLPQKKDSGNLPEKKSKDNKPNMSYAGIGNAALGSLAADGVKSLLTKKENKPASKNDIAELKALLTKRYFPVNNLPNDQFGKYPHYDMETGNIIYFFTQIN